MNRVVLIGNGFDLAHGLPTRYEDFINWYWDKWGQKLRTSSKKVEQDIFCSFVLKETVGLAGWNLVWSFHYQCALKPKTNNIDLVNIAINDSDICDFKINSTFFEQICKAIKTKGWVDIECEYYDLICRYIKDPKSCAYTLSELNNDLHYLRRLLIEYLTFLKLSSPVSTGASISEIIYSPINKDDICISRLSAFWNYVESILQNKEDYIKLLQQYSLAQTDNDGIIKYLDILKKYYKGPAEYKEYSLSKLFYPKHVLLLNFNYTDVADNYKKRVSTINHIHGIQYSPTSVIFGYGDELDEKYKTLLNHSDNECLRNIKSIKYREFSNYRNLLKFIEADSYQVYIMGHSCGNSDRTLLNTLFEHENCVSIKPYYYQNEDGSDNYLEIVQNICRNFTDMKLMRDRVVNKTYCEPLPQILNYYDY